MYCRLLAVYVHTLRNSTCMDEVRDADGLQAVAFIVSCCCLQYVVFELDAVV
jgi:hypothetical protein